MKNIEDLANNYFEYTDVQINLEDVVRLVNSHNLNESNVNEIFIDIKDNINFFKKELSTWNQPYSSGLKLSNLLSYAIEALKLNDWELNGSSNRNRITKLYRLKIQNLRKENFNTTSQISDQFDNIFDDLNSLIGLENIKEEIQALTSLAIIRKRKSDFGIPLTPSSLHMVFVGNAGTGKTTVARLIGNIFKKIGLIKSGHLIETSRKDLIAKHVGHTAQLVAEKFEEAKGGILFIDEAYSLVSLQGSNDFGIEAIETLLKLMEDDRESTVVIAAGYPLEMQKFINSNPGLKSRFANYVFFEDYTTSELITIFKTFVEKDEHILSDSAVSKLTYLFEEKFEQTGTDGNARYVRNLYEKVHKKQAERLVQNNSNTKLNLITITDDDIPNEI